MPRAEFVAPSVVFIEGMSVLAFSLALLEIAAFRYAILLVILVGADKQMFWIKTLPIIAGM
jgi:hypothetical protein